MQQLCLSKFQSRRVQDLRRWKVHGWWPQPPLPKVMQRIAPLPLASDWEMSTWAGRKDHASRLNFFSLLFQCLISTTTLAAAAQVKVSGLSGRLRLCILHYAGVATALAACHRLSGSVGTRLTQCGGVCWNSKRQRHLLGSSAAACGQNRTCGSAPAGMQAMGVFSCSSWSRLMMKLERSKEPGGVSDCRQCMQ